jgi:hypothetical protein
MIAIPIIPDYPWYAEISPASLWLANHVKKGKEELTFRTFRSTRPEGKKTNSPPLQSR